MFLPNLLVFQTGIALLIPLTGAGIVFLGLLPLGILLLTLWKRENAKESPRAFFLALYAILFVVNLVVAGMTLYGSGYVVWELVTYLNR